jgi:hypothetical protein
MEKTAASNFRVTGDEDGGNRFIQNVDTYKPNIKIPE